MILEEMYNGRFYPCETVVADSPRFKQAVKASAALMDTLSERLSKEDYALVEELREQVAIAQCEENESHFKYGFSAGLLVQQEAHTQWLFPNWEQPPQQNTASRKPFANQPADGFFAAPGYGNFTSAYVWPCGWAGWGWPFLSYCWGF